MYQEVILTAILSLLLYALVMTKGRPLYRQTDLTVVDTAGVPVRDKIA